MKTSGFLFLLLCVLFASCHDSKEPASLPPVLEPQHDWSFPDFTLTDPSLEIPHYVTGYMWPEEFLVGCMGSSLPDNRLIILTNGGLYAGYDSESASAREAYQNLCRWNRDMTCDRKAANFDQSADRTICLAVDVVGIDLISDRAWGDRPAGASWADVCWLEGLSPYEHIQSGYTKYFDWTTVAPLFAGNRCYRQPGQHDRKLILTPLSTCTLEDFRMLISWGSHTFIHLSQKPDDVIDHRLTVIFTLADGQVFRTPVTVFDASSQ